QDTAVEYEEVDVGGRQALAGFIELRFGQLDGDEPVGAAVGLAQGLDLLGHFLEREVVDVVLARAVQVGDGVGAAEAHEVVDVAVGVVAEQGTLADPQHAVETEFAEYQGFYGFARELAVALAVEQAVFG